MNEFGQNKCGPQRAQLQNGQVGRTGKADLVHVEVLVARQATDEVNARCLLGLRHLLVLPVQRLVALVGHRVVRLPLVCTGNEGGGGTGVIG